MLHLSKGARWALRIGTAITLAFIYVPLIVIAIYAFNSSNLLEWPPPGLTTHWFPEAIKNTDARDAFVTSLKVGAAATVVALVLGTLASLAVARHRFFGRETVSFLVILPIALPGIVTGVALSDTFTQVLGVSLGLLTVIIGHATFCIVVVYNNAIARFRRLSGNLIEASMDLGANGFETFRYVILPQIGTALLAGGMLAFALSFDEVIVTTFTAGQQSTLPIWMLSELIRPRQRPVTNVVAVFVIIVTLLPILAAYYLTREGEHVGGSSK
jgi:putative spermidine/putrescine transport system permease protein